MSTTTSALFTPLKLGNHTLSHRVVMAPTTRVRHTTEGVPTDLVIEFFRQRAAEGTLLISDATLISNTAGQFPHAPGIYTKDHIEGWKKVVNVVHEKKAVVFLQLWHLGRTGSKYVNPNQEQIVSASAIAAAGQNAILGGDHEVPRALEIDEIKAIIQDYKQAAVNAIEAGFDGVEVHGATGYLVDQFINSNSNQRTDIYGGSIENRARFALEVVDAIADAIGQEKTAIRFSPESKINDMGDETPVATWSHIVTELQKKHPKLAYLHFIEPRSDVFGDDITAEDSLGPYRNIWKGPFITSGGFSNNIPYAKEIAERTGSLISFGRAYLANPDLPERIRNGWELNKYDRSTFYTNEAEGYIDYPFYDKKE